MHGFAVFARQDVQRGATPCNAVQRRATPCNAVQRGATPCDLVQPICALGKTNPFRFRVSVAGTRRKDAQRARREERGEGSSGPPLISLRTGKFLLPALLSPGPAHLTSYPLPPFKPARCEGWGKVEMGRARRSRRCLSDSEDSDPDRRATPVTPPCMCTMCTDVRECASKTRNDKTNPFRARQGASLGRCSTCARVPAQVVTGGRSTE